MAFVIADRVKETCISPGVGTVTLLGASTGYQSFSAVGNGNNTYYCIADQNGNNWEVGIGTYTASGTTLSRDTVLASSNGGAKTNFSAGTQDVFVTQPSERAVYVDTAGSAITPNVSATLGVLYGGTGLNTLTANRIPYGNGTSAFQSSAGLTFDGTTLTASNISSGGSFTFSGGTANGVLYLNGSKVATSGSALTFDGTNFSTTGTATATKLIPTGNVTAGNGMYLPTTNTLAWSTNGAEGMRLDASGNLGIGTTSPDKILTVSKSDTSNAIGTSTAAIAIRNSDSESGGRTADLTFHVGSVVGAINTLGAVTGIFTNYTSSTGGALAFSTNNGSGSLAERMRIDSSGNLGLGVTPSGWDSSIFKGVFQNRSYFSIAPYNAIPLNFLTNNGYYNGSNWIYLSSNPACQQSFDQNGKIIWSTAPSGTAGNAITFTQAMTLDASGNLGIGTTSPSYKLDIAWDSNSTQRVRLRNSNAGTSTITALEIANDANNTLQILQRSSTATNANESVIQNNSGGNLTLSTISATSIIFSTSNTERMRLDSSGNLGLGVTPSAWSVGKAFEVGNLGNGLWTVGSANIYLVSNTYYTGSAYRYAYTNFASAYEQENGVHKWRNAPSGTAGNPITFTQAMTLDASGNLLVGGTSAAFSSSGRGVIEVNGSSAALLGLTIGGAQRGFLLHGGTELTLRNEVNGPLLFATNATEKMRLDSSGNLGIGTNAPSALLTLAAGTATANTGPLKFTSGTNLTTPEAGAVEYDGTVMTATSNTSFKRGTIPLTNYVSGAGTNLGVNTETTLQNLLPAANDTITLPSGTYFLDMAFTVTRTGNSTTSATARLNILGGGNAAGNFTGMSISAIIAGGAANNFSFSAVNINTSNVLTAASATNGGVYTMTLRGMLKITTAGTIVPQYNLSATLGTGAAGGASVSVLYMRLQQIDSQNNTTVGPAGTGWA